MKILYVTTIVDTMHFFLEHIKMLQEEGNKIELACNCNSPYNKVIKEWGYKMHHISFSRNSYSINNLKSYVEIKKLIENENYDIVHTHTPNASAIVRVACKNLKKNNLKVIYTAHGFHFYKGGPIKNWLLFFPVEWLCAHWTDVLITINKEDFLLAQYCMKAKKIEYVPGIGIDIKKFSEQKHERKTIRKELGIKPEEIIILSVGELNYNKNHEVVIRAIKKLKRGDVHYFIAGQGKLKDFLKGLSKKLGLEKQIHLLGFRDDVVRLYQGADIYVLPSFREGLNVSLMEAMTRGLPVICSDIRGNRDLIEEGRGGILCRPNRSDEFYKAIETILNNSDMQKQMVSFNREKIKSFDTVTVINELNRIYKNV